jgi:competence protein ComEA
VKLRALEAAMSDLQPDPADLQRPLPPLSWRERVTGWAEAFDLTPGRLFVGLAVLAVGGFLAWRMLAPAPLPPEMELPFASTTVVAGGGSGGTGAGNAESPDGPGPAEAAVATPAGSTELTEVVVHVAGAVVAPGVQRLPAGARVIDAVDAAGGAAGDAELARINLAAPLEDGQQIYVPRFGELVPAAAGGGTASAGTAPGDSGATGSATGGLVNLNQATPAELEELPGVGPAIAQAIIDHREQEGPFASVEQLLDVRGIGDARLEQLRDLVTV